jgi:hypothetical protein
MPKTNNAPNPIEDPRALFGWDRSFGIRPSGLREVPYAPEWPEFGQPGGHGSFGMGGEDAAHHETGGQRTRGHRTGGRRTGGNRTGGRRTGGQRTGGRGGNHAGGSGGRGRTGGKHKSGQKAGGVRRKSAKSR